VLRGFLARLPLTDRVTFATELVASVLYGVFAGLALPLIPIVARRIGMSPEAITAMVTMQFVGALFGIVLGHMADRLPKLPFAVWPALVSRALIGLLAFARTPVSYLVVVSAFNLLVNLGGPAYGSIMRTNYSDANRGRLMGNIRIAIVLVSAVFSTLAGILLSGNESLVRWLFPVAALFGVASSLAFNRIRVRKGPVSEDAPHAPSSFAGSFRASLGVLRRNGPYMIFLGILAVCATPDKLAIPLEPIYLVDHLRISYGDTSFILGTIASVASIGGYFIWARALKKLSSFTVLAVVVFLFAGRFAALALARTSTGLVPMSILSGFTNAGWDLVPIFCMIALTDPATFSLSLGLSTTLFGIRGILGPSLGTLLYSSGALPLQGIFFLITGITAAGGILLLFFSKRLRVKR
jgi:MFS family permease